jgi:hypothetical protein
VGGYRDLLICLVFSGRDGLRIIGEVQVRPAHGAAFRAVSCCASRASRLHRLAVWERYWGEKSREEL